MSVFVDTSALYTVLDADDDEHSRAVAEWHRLVRGAFPLVTTSYVSWRRRPSSSTDLGWMPLARSIRTFDPS